MIIKKKELSFLRNDPGAVKHGNFINYYAFNTVQSRLDHLHHKMFPMTESDKIIVLDIGCNSGDLTCAVHHYMHERYEDATIEILAIELDPALVSTARLVNNRLNCIEFEEGNIMDENTRAIVHDFLKKHDRERFDFTFCFSITMWIHLNNGDSGLADFLKFIQGISTSIIIEPQQWKSYKAAQKRLKKGGATFENFDTLQIRGKVDSYIEKSLLEGNFTKIFQSVQTKWGRIVQCYRLNDEILIHSYNAYNMIYV